MEFDSFVISECGSKLEINKDFAVMDSEVGVSMMADGLGSRLASRRSQPLNGRCTRNSLEEA